MGTLEYDVGEKKYVTAVIRSREKNELVIINSASWELYEKEGTNLQNSYLGNPNFPEGCIVKDNTVSALVEGTKKGTFVLKFTVTIGPEVIVEKVIIKVN